MLPLEETLLLEAIMSMPLVLLPASLTRGEAVKEAAEAAEAVAMDCRLMHTAVKVTNIRPELNIGIRIIKAKGIASSSELLSEVAC